jgi:hypothetical protein
MPSTVTRALDTLVFAALVAACGGVDHVTGGVALDADVHRDGTVANSSSSASGHGEDAGHTKPETGPATRDAVGAAPDSSAPCADAGIAFQLLYDGPICLGSVCGEDWLSIAGPADASVSFLPGFVQCSECAQCEKQPNSCYNGCPIPPASPGPLSFSWNGQIHPFSTCPGGEVTCTTSSCATAGAYTATMCLHLPVADAGLEGCNVGPQPQPTCKTFSFTWPPSQGGETVTWTP